MNKNKSLTELENDDWGRAESLPEQNKTPVLERAHNLRYKPLAEYNDDDIRFMIVQEIGLKFLVPMALDILVDDPLRLGTHYHGDILSALITVRAEFWKEYPALWFEVDEIILKAEIIVDSFRENLAPKIRHFRENNA